MLAGVNQSLVDIGVSVECANHWSRFHEIGTSTHNVKELHAISLGYPQARNSHGLAYCTLCKAFRQRKHILIETIDIAATISAVS